MGFPGTLGFISTELLVDSAVEVSPYVGIAVVTAAALNGIAVVRAYLLIFTGARHHSTVLLGIGDRERFAVLTFSALDSRRRVFPPARSQYAPPRGGHDSGGAPQVAGTFGPGFGGDAGWSDGVWPGPARRSARGGGDGHCAVRRIRGAVICSKVALNGGDPPVPDSFRGRPLNADFRGGAICLFRTHFLGWSGRFFHGFDASAVSGSSPISKFALPVACNPLETSVASLPSSS